MALCRCFVVSIYLSMLVSPRRYSVQGISPDVFTRPKDLGFEVYSKSIPSKVFHLIQPKAEGAILAHIGPYNFTYFYRMASISVFLNTHLIFSHKAYTSPLYALCSVERSNIVAKPNAVLVCEFSVYVSSFGKHVFSNSSCVIHSMNETECATQLDLDFLRLQFSSSNSQVSILVRYNVTAYQLNKTTAEFHPSDITNLLIHNSYVLPPVTVISQPDFRWLTLIKDTDDVSVIQVGIPSLRTNNAIPIVLAVSPQSPIQGFKLKLLLSSTLRYHFENEKRTEEARAWKVSVASKRYGAIVRARRIKPVGTGSRNQSLGSNDLESSRIIISELLLEHIAKSDSESTTSPWDGAFKRADSTQLDYSESPLEQGTEDDNAESEESGGQPVIHVQLIQLVPPNISMVRRSQSFPTLTLMAPQLVPQPGAMHVFVQFEPKDVVEPPWYPAAPSPEPLKLRVIGLIPYPKIKFSARKSDDALFAQSSAGTLTDITHHVLCRPASLRSTGERAFDGSSPSGPTCLSTMRQAPSELEEFSSFQNGPLHGLQPSMLTQAAGGLGARFGWSDQIVLAIGALSGLPSPIVPSIYGPVYGPKEKAGWQWRDWRGPTVRRWMLEGFRIHVSRKHLRRINAWQVPGSGFRDKRPSNE
ncbi:hypothetical protein FGIG_00614 [Fasciola gigantica]|uniref:DUF5735 domain-containing protein n=1 Tax=Fasciola gigantica TaxID=46835 RepID=A0A504YQS8_FASGI|nr:hypothetical protein FGIG_00614 [Fasciola gigantica]